MVQSTDSAKGEDLDRQKAEDGDLAAISSRRDREAPAAIAVNGWRFHHLGIPTQAPREGERYLPALKM